MDEETMKIVVGLKEVGYNPVVALNQKKTPIILNLYTGEVLAKRCSKCLRMKLKVGMTKDRRSNNGINSKCLSCGKEYKTNRINKARQKVVKFKRMD